MRFADRDDEFDDQEEALFEWEMERLRSLIPAEAVEGYHKEDSAGGCGGGGGGAGRETADRRRRRGAKTKATATTRTRNSAMMSQVRIGGDVDSKSSSSISVHAVGGGSEQFV